MKKIVLFVCMLCFGLAAQEIVLPKPDLKSGKSLMECFSLRRSSRNFADKKLPLQMISEILFAADGINRTDGHKTVPTALNKQNQTVYAVTADGVYFYNNKKHSLVLVTKGDFRKDCGMQPFHAKAPLILVYVSDMAAIGNTAEQKVLKHSPSGTLDMAAIGNTAEQKALYAGNHSGSASQNVYLYAASQGLSTVICGSIRKDILKKNLKLQNANEAVFSQPIGFSK